MKHVPQPPDAGALVPPADFRQSLRLLAGGVSVITVGRGPDISGLTVTSVTPLSLDPPTLTVSVNRQSSSWPILLKERAFGVNFLAADQQRVAEDFSGRNGLKGAERYRHASWETLETGAPILKGTLVGIDCAVDEIFERHSHGIVIGRVAAITGLAPASGLVYWQGRYLPLSGDASRALPFVG